MILSIERVVSINVIPCTTMSNEISPDLISETSLHWRRNSCSILWPEIYGACDSFMYYVYHVEFDRKDPSIKYLKVFFLFEKKWFIFSIYIEP